MNTVNELLERAKHCRRIATSFADRPEVASLWIRWAEEYEQKAENLLKEVSISP